MGLIDFVKEAGEKLFGRGTAQAAMAEVKADPANDAKVKAANDAAGDAIVTYIKAQNLSATGLTVTFDGAASAVAGDSGRSHRSPAERGAPARRGGTRARGGADRWA